MKKLLQIGALSLMLGGCAQLQTFEQVVTSTVSPTQALVAANAFDAAESGATAYLVYCKANLSASSCAPANRRAVIRYTRAGRAARNQIEQVIQGGSASVPAVAYNALVTAVTNLKATPASNYVGAQ